LHGGEALPTGCAGASTERLLRLSLVVGFGAGVYFATLWVAGFRLRDFKRSAAE
jgi:peptidoglycan biosynthesis protein MviN/MurJ (putative lipid II flippase)